MRDAPIGMRQVMDWQAAFWAGLISGVIFNPPFLLFMSILMLIIAIWIL